MRYKNKFDINEMCNIIAVKKSDKKLIRKILLPTLIPAPPARNAEKQTF